MISYIFFYYHNQDMLRIGQSPNDSIGHFLFVRTKIRGYKGATRGEARGLEPPSSLLRGGYAPSNIKYLFDLDLFSSHIR